MKIFLQSVTFLPLTRPNDIDAGKNAMPATTANGNVNEGWKNFCIKKLLAVSQAKTVTITANSPPIDHHNKRQVSKTKERIMTVSEHR